MESNQLQEKVIFLIGEVMEVTEHKRKFDYINDKTLKSHTLYGDSKIWSCGDYNLYQKIEQTKKQALLGEVELASYSLYNQYENIANATVPNFIETPIDTIIQVKNLIGEIIKTYKTTSELDAEKYKNMFKTLDMEIKPEEMGNFYGQLSDTIKELTKSYQSEHGLFKTYHAYGTDTIPIDAKFESPLTILSGYYPEVWLNGLITTQKAKTAAEMDDVIRINLYNSKDIFDPTYEYFIIAVTYKSTLFIVNDEIKHANIWARFQCRSRNNRRAEERFEKITLPYDAIANFEVARKDKSEISKVKTLTFDSFHNNDKSLSSTDYLINLALEALNDMGIVNVSTSEIKSRGNHKSIVGFFNELGDNIAMGTIENKFSDGDWKEMSVTVYDKLIVADTIDIKTLENFEKMFFPVFGISFRSIMSSMNGDYSKVQKGEFGSKQLLLNSGMETNDAKLFDWNKDFDSDKEFIDREERLAYVTRFIKHAKQLEESGLLTGTELALVDKVTDLQLNTDSSLRHTKDISQFQKLFPVIGKTNSNHKQEIWLSLESERERIQGIFNKVKDYIESRVLSNTCGYTSVDSPLYMQIGEHIYDHKESFIKYAFEAIVNDTKLETNVTRVFDDNKINRVIVKHIKNANENIENVFSTWRCQFLINSRKDYMRSGKLFRRNDLTHHSVFDTDETGAEINFCRVIVKLYTAEQICEALGHDSVDQLPLLWRSFLDRDFQIYGGNSNLDNVHPFTEIYPPRVLSTPINIGLVITKQEYVNLLKSKGVSHVSTK